MKIENLETVKRMSAKMFRRQKVTKFSRGDENFYKRNIFADKVFTDKVYSKRSIIRTLKGKENLFELRGFELSKGGNAKY